MLEERDCSCGCFVKVHVCPRCLGVAERVISEEIVARELQYELREGREASEDSIPFK